MSEDLEPSPGWWAVVELTDHRRVGGLLSEQVVAGTSFVRIDVPAGEGRRPLTQLYAPHAVYSITAVDEPVALRVAGRTLQAFGDTDVTPADGPGDASVPAGLAAGEATAQRPHADRAGADGSGGGGGEADGGGAGGGEADKAALTGAGAAPDDRELLTVSELASRYTCSRSTVMRWQTFDDFPEPAVRGPRRLAVYELADVKLVLSLHPELLRTHHRT
nr:hypothetical protein [Micromonospora sp. DSM 115978]